MCRAPRGDPRRVRVADVVERVRGAGVLGEPLRVEVELAGQRVDVDVLEDRPEPLRGREDVGLVHRRQADGLGVAAAFEVEGVAVAPAVLVVADEAAQRVGGQRRLARAAEAEEDARVAALAHVDRGVHRQHALVGHQVVHHRERGLLDLARVARPDDDDLHPLEVEQDRGPGAGALGGRVGLEAGHVDDREVGLERRQVLARRPAEQVAREDAGPRGLGVDAEAPAVVRMGADVQVLGVQLAVREVGHQPAAQAVVVGLAELLVDLAPPDLGRARRLADDELVARRAPGVLAGPDDERPVGGDHALVGGDRAFVELGDREVGQDVAAEPGRWGGPRHRHDRMSSTAPRAARAHSGSLTGRA